MYNSNSYPWYWQFMSDGSDFSCPGVPLAVVKVLLPLAGRQGLAWGWGCQHLNLVFCSCCWEVPLWAPVQQLIPCWPKAESHRFSKTAVEGLTQNKCLYLFPPEGQLSLVGFKLWNMNSYNKNFPMHCKPYITEIVIRKGCCWYVFWKRTCSEIFPCVNTSASLKALIFWCTVIFCICPVCMSNMSETYSNNLWEGFEHAVKTC